MVTEEQVKEALSKVIDPEIGIDIVNLGFIYDIRIDGGIVDVDMTLTTRGCPLHQTLGKQAEDVIKDIEGVEQANITMVWDPPWNPTLMSDAAKKRLGFSDEMLNQ